MGLMTDNLSPPADPGTGPLSALLMQLAAQRAAAAQGSGGAAPLAAPTYSIPGGPTMPSAGAGSPQVGMQEGSYDQGGQNPSFLDKVVNRLMPTREGYKGLLSPQEVSDARRRGLLTAGLSMLANSAPVGGHPALGTAQALGVGLQQGLGAYDQAQEQRLQEMQQGLGFRYNQHIMQVRAQAAQMFQPQPGETPQQALMRITAASDFAARNGDLEMATTLAKAAEPLRPYLRGMGAMGTGQYKSVNTGGALTQYDAATGKYRNPNQPDDTAPDAWVTTLQKTDTVDHKAEVAERTAAAAANAATRATASADHADLSYASGFAKSAAAKPYLDRAAVLERAGTTIGALLSSDPNIRTAALSSVAAAVASLEPQKPQLRALLYEKLGTVDPSFTGKTSADFYKYILGQPAPKQALMLNKFFQYVAQNDKAEYQQLYDKSYSARPSAQKYMSQYDPATVYGFLKPTQKTGAPGTPGNASAVDQFLGR